MKLDEFKAALASDATKRCEVQEQIIKGLYQTIDKQYEKIEALENDKRQLFNRCHVLSRGALCIFCGFKKECPHQGKGIFDTSNSNEEGGQADD